MVYLLLKINLYLSKNRETSSDFSSTLFMINLKFIFNKICKKNKIHLLLCCCIKKISATSCESHK